MASTNVSAPTPLPAILYPTGLPTINYLDTIAVYYESSWSGGTNLSCNCQEALNNSNLCWAWALNPIPDNGTFVFHELGVVLYQYIVQYPTNCWFNLYPNIAHDGKAIVGGNFTMTSTPGTASTWAAGTVFIASVSPPTTASTTAPPQTSSVDTLITTTSARTSSPTSPLQTSLTSHSTGLSSSAKVGVGVGSGLGAIFLLCAFIYIMLLRRRLAETERRTEASQKAVQTTQEQIEGLEERFEKHQSKGPFYEKSGQPDRDG